MLLDSVCFEFTIGLESLHQKSKAGTKLRVLATDWEDVTRMAEYSHFKVESESSLYKMTVSGECYEGEIKMGHRVWSAWIT